MKGAEFSVRRIQSSSAGNQTLPTNGNPDTMVYNILPLRVGVRWMSGERRAVRRGNRWMGEVRRREKQQKREQLVQIKSRDWCVSFTKQISVCFGYWVNRLSCDTKHISEIFYKTRSYIIQMEVKQKLPLLFICFNVDKLVKKVKKFHRNHHHDDVKSACCHLSPPQVKAVSNKLFHVEIHSIFYSNADHK